MRVTRRHHQLGASLLEAAVVLPVMITMLMVVLGLASYFNQTFWVDQTAYNTSLMSSELDSTLNIGEKSSRVAALASKLSMAHQEEGHQTFLKFNPATDIKSRPFNPAVITPGVSSNDTVGLEKRTTDVEIVGTVKNLMNFPISMSQKVYAQSLVGTTEVSQSTSFAGSGLSWDCCGFLGNQTTPCVVGGAYQNPTGCDTDSVGYVKN
jgi:hypothetical protein